ncbi:hypothetical protein [Sphaerochaeta halotolerans]|nr:hypothetical protein [Sphaerochaeta halotolerans]
MENVTILPGTDDTIHEGERDEAREMRVWARSQGWTGRNASPKQMI